MKRTIIWTIMLCLLAGGASAMFVRLSEAQLTAQSDRIVVGQLIGRATLRLDPNLPPRALGVIQVRETLKGPAGLTILFLDLPPAGALRVSSDLDHGDGETGLWFLHPKNPGREGIYAADHPQRFVPLAQAGPQIKLLKEQFGR